MQLYEAFMPMGTTELLIASVVIIISYFLIKYFSKKRQKLPPGPNGYPILGCLPYITKDPHLKLQEMASKYGDVFSMYIGSRLVVILNGVDAVREGMNKLEFLGRPPEGPFPLGDIPPNITTISGKTFHDQRKFILHSMRDLGFGKTVMEECMKVELECFLRKIEGTEGKPFNFRGILSSSVMNNITALTYGTRYIYGDPRTTMLQENQKRIVKFGGQTAIHIFIPWISKFPFIKTLFGYKRVLAAIKETLDFNRSQIAEHKKTLDPCHTRDFIDKYILEIKQAEEKKLADNSFTENMLLGNVVALTGAGNETINVTLKWFLLTIAAYTDVQKKIYNEIIDVVGSERMPAYTDQKQMPYTQAVIMEIMRWRCIVPLNLLRFTYEDTTLREYDIPKDTIILSNIWSAHYDTRYWKQPQKFNPERFLSEDRKSVVKSVVKSEAYMPFSVGRRSCPGETMAVVELFIYFTAIIQRFEITFPEGVIPDLEGVLSISLTPKPQDLCFISRSSK